MEHTRTYDSSVVSSAGADVIPSRTGSGRSMHWLGPILTPEDGKLCPDKTRSRLFPLLPASVLFPHTCVHRIPHRPVTKRIPCVVYKDPFPKYLYYPLPTSSLVGVCFPPNSPHSHNTILVTDYGLPSALAFYKRSVY